MVNVVRGLVRPFVVVVMTLALLGYVALGVAIPDKLWEAYFIALLWWFASRSQPRSQP